MGLCSSKRSVREEFNPTGSTESNVSNQSSRRLNPSRDQKPRNGEETNDKDEENDLLDTFEVEHLLLNDVWRGSFFSSPIEENLRTGNLNVLDVVCGPGHWIYVTALEFSRSKFTGFHASPSPTCKKPHIPHNAHILRINILDGTYYGDGSFDYVHMRALTPKYTDDQWKLIVFHMTRLTKPGGYCEIEVGDYERFENKGPLMKKMIDAYHRCLEQDGFKINVLDDLERIMRDTKQFSSLQKQSYKIPIGKSVGEYGKMASKHFTRIMNSQSGHISSYLGQAPEDFGDNMAGVTTELDQHRSICLSSIRVFGQKIEK